VSDLAQRYGQWQNTECRDMKAHLLELDMQGSGRVPLGLLYAQPASESYRFSESADYLRKIGALDETGSTPPVLIENYLTGPSNCIASSSYYSVCCLSNCDTIMNEIEQRVLAPKASPQQLLNIAHSISSVTLSTGLIDKLERVAAHHGGEVPIHGRLFAQWLHFAFPHECPYPAILESAKTLATSEWHAGLYTASNEERVDHLLSAQVTPDAAGENGLEGFWSDHEVLPCLELQNHGMSLASVMRVTVQLAAVILGLRSIVGAWRLAIGPVGKSSVKYCKKSDDLDLGFCV